MSKLLKNQRPTAVDALGRVTYHNREQLGFHVDSQAGWRRRGWAVKKEEKHRPVGFVVQWNGMYYLTYKVYNTTQLRPLSGKKARQRRKEYFSED